MGKIYKSVQTPFMMSGELRHDLHNCERYHEEICEFCHGTGVMIQSNPFGITKENEPIKLAYDNQCVSRCNRCVNGIVRICNYCGKILHINESYCGCKISKQIQKDADDKKSLEKFEKAEKISVDEARDRFGCLWVEETENVFDASDVDEIYEALNDGYHVYGTTRQPMTIDAYSILEEACEEMYEDAFHSCTNIDALQKVIDEWIKKYGPGDTYCPDYKYAIVEKS